MASLFKQQVVRYISGTGRRVPKDSPEARKVVEKSRKWYAEYKDENSVLKRVALSTDKSASQSLLNDILRQVERKKAGFVDPYEQHYRRKIQEHIDDYDSFLQSKEDSEQHVTQTIGRITRLVIGCSFRTLADIDGTKVATWLSEKRSTSQRFSAQTSNFYLDCFKYFCAWLVRHDRMRKNPVLTLDRINVDTDRRHDRRSLSDEEFARLIAAAERGEQVEGMCGADRAMLYILAAWTGFRRRELSSITKKNIKHS